MKKRMLSLALALSLAISLFVPAFAAETEPVTPTAPEWIDEEDYIIFPGDEVYLPENWAKIETFRSEAVNGAKEIDAPTFVWEYGEGSAGYQYEVGVVWLKCAENAGFTNATARKALTAAARAFEAAESSWQNAYVEEPDELYCRLGVYAARAYLLNDNTYNGNSSTLGTTAVMIDQAITKLGMTIDDIYDAPHMELVTPEKRYLVSEALNEYLFKHDRPISPSSEGYIQIFLDSSYIKLDVPAVLSNGRTMIPIRAVAEALGAEVGWEESTRQVTLTRAGATIVMTVDSPTATVNGETITMDVAPHISGGRTLLPVRYVAEFFGQKVEWEESTRRIFITEDKSEVKDSNLEAWALPMGAMLSWINVGATPTQFGARIRTVDNIKACRETLSSSWSISNREDLVSTVISMTLYGHDASFREMAADVKQRSEAERKAISEASSAWPYFMWEYTEQLDEKWGDRGIMAWDLFRMSNLVQWGYTAGYVTYEEALMLLEPAATLLCEYFSTWDEAYENYLDGYNWWARNDVLGKDIWETSRGKRYLEMKADPTVGLIFDDTLFETGVIGLPEEN